MTNKQITEDTENNWCSTCNVSRFEECDCDYCPTCDNPREYCPCEFCNECDEELHDCHCC